MRKTLAAAALAVGAVTAVPHTAGAAGNDCTKWWNHEAGVDFTTAHGRCNSVQDADNKFRVHAVLQRISDNTRQDVYGPFRSCDGATSKVTWITDVYLFVSYEVAVWDVDDVADGC